MQYNRSWSTRLPLLTQIGPIRIRGRVKHSNIPGGVPHRLGWRFRITCALEGRLKGLAEDRNSGPHMRRISLRPQLRPCLRPLLPPRSFTLAFPLTLIFLSFIDFIHVFQGSIDTKIRRMLHHTHLSCHLFAHV